MDRTIRERQRRFSKKMYKAGFKRYPIWVKRQELRQTEKLVFTSFVKKLRKITATGWDKEELNSLFWLLLKIAKGQKGVNRFKKM